MSKINYHDYSEKLNNLNGADESGKEKNYSKSPFAESTDEEDENFSPQFRKLVLYQNNLIRQQQCLIDILSGMHFNSTSGLYL